MQIYAKLNVIKCRTYKSFRANNIGWCLVQAFSLSAYEDVSAEYKFWSVSIQQSKYVASQVVGTQELSQKWQ